MIASLLAGNLSQFINLIWMPKPLDASTASARVPSEYVSLCWRIDVRGDLILYCLEMLVGADAKASRQNLPRAEQIERFQSIDWNSPHKHSRPFRGLETWT